MLNDVSIRDATAIAKGKVRMALDACYRAVCGLDTHNYPYAVAQLQRVASYAQDAAFHADLAELLESNM